MAINFAVAKYAGTCSKCRGSIPVNSTFVWGPYGSKTRFHPECAPAAKPAPAPAPDGQQPTVETVLETARVWSEHQTCFFTEATDGLQNLLVIAVAGSGKTTALVEASRRLLAKRATTTIKYFVFNKSNAREAEKKMPQAVDSSTFHRAGNAAVAARIGRRYQVKANKVNRLLGDFVQHGTVSEYEADAFGSEVCKLVGLGKVHLIGATMPDTIENWKHLIDHFGIDFDVDPDEWAERGAPGMDAEDRAIAIAQKLLAASNADLSVLDYDDQLYLPIKMHLPMPRFDVVMADEAQDTNPARRAILRKTLKPGGKLMGVGDPRQAIYGFTGADADAMDLIRRDFDCKVLPLSVNYRSGTAIIDLAKTLCPEITARPGAPTGTVETYDAFALADFRQTDAIICRVVAPLITIAYRCIAKQIPCVVLGRDIGAGLIALIQKLNGKRKQAITIDELLTRADVYLEREIARWTAKGEEDKVQSVIDKVESIKAAIEALPEGRRSVNGLIEYIDSIFGEVEEDEDGKKLDTRLTLCSIHKSKGLEWERVFVLDRHRMPSKWARQEWQKEQEQNLIYVAYTRAMESLVFIESETVR